GAHPARRDGHLPAPGARAPADRLADAGRGVQGGAVLPAGRELPSRPDLGRHGDGRGGRQAPARALQEACELRHRRRRDPSGSVRGAEMPVGEGTVRGGVVVTGTEVLTGRITDRNGPWIAERLGELGVEVSHIVCVGDRKPDLEGALRFLTELGVDLIVTSGGLGPTADDLTVEAVAEFAGRELVLDQAMEERIAEILAGFARRLRFDADALRDANRKQAMVPVGATTIDPAGTAP